MKNIKKGIWPKSHELLKKFKNHRYDKEVTKLNKWNKKSQSVKNHIADYNSKVKFFSTLKFKFIVSFFIPVAFIIILGIISFIKASSDIQANYEKETVSSINMAAEYLRFGLHNVEAASNQYVSDAAVLDYLRNSGDNATLSNARKNISNSLAAKKISDEFIQNIFMISEKTLPIYTTTKLTIGDDFLTGFTETDIGTYLQTNRIKVVWEGQDDYLDQKLGTSPKDYSMRIIRYFPAMNSLLIIETKTETITNILDNLAFDKSGILMMVTPDGREITPSSQSMDSASTKGKATADSVAQPTLTKESFYQKALSASDTSGSGYVDYKGTKYLFMYSKIGTTGSMLCALMPKSTISSQADSIRDITVIIVIIACIIALLIAASLSMGIDRTIQGINSKLKQAAKGDLTVTFTSKRKDEFNVLINQIQITFSNMKELINQVKQMSSEVSGSSSNVTQSSQEFLNSAREISSAMAEIEMGINQQAKESEECLVQMDKLSQRIVLVSENTKEISQIADNTKRRVIEGTVINDELNHQTLSTISITTDIINEIEKLADKMSSINKIINVINEIANQTNLLSLNASIEAARAGEFGKGFAVVASEIKKLAEQSQASANDIKKIIGSIQTDTLNTVGTARNVEEVLKKQESAVKNTIVSYQDINQSVEKLLIYLTQITENVNNIEETRVNTLTAIETISAVLEETAAGAINVNQNSMDQLKSIESLDEAARKLNSHADSLVMEVQKFQIERLKE